MRIQVESQAGTIGFEVQADRLVAAWPGPPESPEGDLAPRVRAALEASIDYPPLRSVVVPGDRVVVPFDLGWPEAPTFLAEVAAVLRDVGVESIKAIVDGRRPDRPTLPLPEGVELVVHDPEDRESLAYLASTAADRRVYLHRLVADADCVVPIGRIGFDPAFGVAGPWTTIEPGLSDKEPPGISLLAPAERPASALALAEAIEVAWLLGCQYQVGAIAGRTGILEVLAGQTDAILARGTSRLESAWSFEADDQADLVVVGVGSPERAGSPRDLVAAVRRGLRCVRRGGKLVVLSGLDSEALAEAVRGDLVPRGDWAKAFARADLYLASAATPDEAENLGFTALDRPEQAGKLAATAPSVIAFGQADRARPIVAE